MNKREREICHYIRTITKICQKWFKFAAFQGFGPENEALDKNESKSGTKSKKIYSHFCFRSFIAEISFHCIIRYEFVNVNLGLNTKANKKSQLPEKLSFLLA